MSYRFKGNESIGKSVERIALAQLDEALERSRAKRGLDEAVHDVRVCFKKLRGLIRLVRAELSPDKYKRENKSFRNINRKLSKVRDSAALTEILDKLSERFSDQLKGDAFASVRTQLTKVKQARVTDKKRALAEARKRIVAERRHVKKWSIDRDKFPAIGAGLSHTYASGRKGFARAYQKQNVRAFHEWRKDVKYFWYHVQLLRDLWAGFLKDYADEIKDLVDYLSDDHDLALLRKRMLAESNGDKESHEYEALLGLIDKRRAELEARARVLGEKVYAESPEAFESRFHEYWRAWRLEEKTRTIAAHN